MITIGSTQSNPSGLMKPSEINANFLECETISQGQLGEVRIYALSISGSVTKAALQALGWAICDGTTPSSQGISDATIEGTPNLENKFFRMSNDETSGTTGGATQHRHTVTIPEMNIDFHSETSTGAPGTYNTTYASNYPPYYEMVYFIKVKTI